MLASLLYVILAILALSFLIFIHELGHYIVARRTGMRVETFSIGFGKPIYTWIRDGVKWQIGWLLFGGFVKIAGTDTDNKKDLYKIPDGFFGKGPWARIKVAFAGPLVNILFAFLVFFIIWSTGGRTKSFSQYTSKLGWVDPKSELYAQGVRPGDEITSYDGHGYSSFQDHIIMPMTSGNKIKVQGFKVDYRNEKKTPFDYTVSTYKTMSPLLGRDVVTAGILDPANYIIYDRLPSGKDNPLPEGSPLKGSGIQYGDRILWADGEFVNSAKQLDDLLNDNRVLLTIKRGDEILLRRVPRVQVLELRPEAEYREELIDWQYAGGYNRRSPESLYTIPYNLTSNAVVENILRFIDKDDEEEAFSAHPFSEKERPLQPGDKIIAVNGIPVKFSYQLLAELQEDKVNVIVQRSKEALDTISWKQADQGYNTNIDWKAFDAITRSIGTDMPIRKSGNLFLLSSIIPKSQRALIVSKEDKAWSEAQIAEKKREIQEIKDPEERRKAMKLLDYQLNRLLLGIPVQDRKVIYNPGPFTMFKDVSNNIWRTLQGLFSFSLSPKYIMGPVGIVQVVQQTTMLVGIKEALFWLGMISLNLGILNLLPIPVLDGGQILMAFFEMVSKKRIKPKTMEKLVIPFAVLLIVFFVYLTFNDLTRIFGRFIPW